MLEAALELTEELNALTVTLDLGMEDVIRRAGVPRSSAYRLWAYRGDFIADVLVSLSSVASLGMSELEDTSLSDARNALLARLDELDTVEGRRAVKWEIAREFVPRHFETIATSKWWNTYVALIAAAHFMPSEETAERIAVELQRNDRAFLNDMAGYYEAMGSLLGLRPRAPLTWRHFAISAAAELEGFGLRRSMIGPTARAPREAVTDVDDWTLDELVNAPIMATPPGSDAANEWFLPALTFLAILDAFTEEDPNWSLLDLTAPGAA
jgi:hypothetical protein